jgi:hypothetical protein
LPSACHCNEWNLRIALLAIFFATHMKTEGGMNRWRRTRTGYRQFFSTSRWQLCE